MKKIIFFFAILLFFAVSLNAAILTNNFISCSTNSVSRASAAGAVFQYKLYLNSSEYTSGDGYYVTVYDARTNNISSHYDISTPVYTTDHWEVEIKPVFNASIRTNVFIGIGKNAGSDGNTMTNEYSIEDLGITNGSFSITYAVLSIQYSACSAAQIEQAETNGLYYTYHVYYPDTSYQETSQPLSYSITVFNSNKADVTSDFIVGTPEMYFGSWRVYIKARETTAVKRGYTITITKTNEDTLAPIYATVPPASGGLGETNGAFEVINAHLHVHFTARSSSVIAHGTTNAIVFSYNVYYNNEATEETDDTGYTYHIYNNSNTDVSGNFTISNCGYHTDHWEVKVSALQNAVVGSNYYLTIQKSAGSEGDILSESSSTNGLGANGLFSVTNTALSLTYTARNNAVVQKADGIGTTYTYTIAYPDGSPKTNGSGYIIRVFNNLNTDVSGVFQITAPIFITNHWEATILPKDTALIGSNYTIEIEKTNTGTEDTLSPIRSDSILGTAGRFNVTPAALSITYTSRNNASIERTDPIGTLYFYNVYYPDGITEETNDSGYSIHILAANNTDVSYNFTVTNHIYSNNRWQVRIIAHSTAAAATGYRIQIEKTAGSKGDTLAAEISTNDLAGNGTFQVTPATLAITYNTRSTASIEQADGIGVVFTYRIFYPDSISEETNDSGYTVTVYNTNDANVTSNFIVSAPVYTSNHWEVSVRANRITPIAAGYHIGISKTAGGKGDVMTEERSDDGDLTDGTFRVSNAVLSISFNSNASTIIVRDDGIGTRYQYTVLYGDGITELSNDGASFTTTVYDSGLLDVSTNFQISTPVYSNNTWNVTIKAALSTPLGSGYSIGIQKSAGSSGDTLIEERSDVDLGINGQFQVVNVFLTVVFNSNSRQHVEPADGIGTTYYYNVYFPNMTTEETNDAGYIVEVHDSSWTVISGNCTISAPQYTNGEWQTTVIPDDTVSPAQNYRISLRKNGGDGNLAQTGSTNIPFEVTTATLAITFTARSPSVIARNDGNGTRYTYRIYYKDGATEETNDSGYSIIVRNSSGTNVTADFSVSNPTYGAGWTTDIEARTTASIDTNYYIEVSKTAGGENCILPAEAAPIDLNQNGYFDITNAALSITFLNRDTARLFRADGSGITYSYDVLYPNGTPETNQSGYHITVYNSSLADVSSNFIIAAPVYSAGHWTVNIQGTATTPADTGYRIGIRKTNGDLLTEEVSTVDLGGAGEFEITDLSITYVSRNNAAFERADGIGTTYTFDLLYNNGPIEKTNGNGYTVHVYNAAGTPVTGQFTISPLAYNSGAGNWTVTIQANDTTTIAAGYHLGIVKTSGTDGSALIEEISTNDLTAGNGLFEVLPATLNLSNISRSAWQFEKVNGIGTTYLYRVYYDDGITEENNGNGYSISVYSNNGVNVTAQFTVSAPVYVAGRWQVTINALPHTSIGTNFYIGILKNPVGSDDSMTEEISTLDLSTNGVFDVYTATLNITYLNRSVNIFTRNDGSGVDYTYRIFYDDGITQKTDGDGYTVLVYDNTGVPVTNRYTISAPVYTAGRWNVNIQADQFPSIVDFYSNHYISISKSAGTDGDTLSEETALLDLGNPGGTFNVANLTIDYSNRSSAVFERGDGSGTSYTFNVYYPDGSEELIDTAAYQINVYNNLGINVTSDFNITGPTVVSGNHWTVNIQAYPNSPIGTNFYIGIQKPAGTTNAQLLEEYSTVDLAAAGRFTVTAAGLNITYISRNNSVFERADGSGTTYQYQLYFDDGVSIKSNGTGYTATVYSNDGTDRTAQFSVAGPAWNSSTGHWNVTIESYDTTSCASNYYISITKTAGSDGDILTEEVSTNDLSVNGTFAVNNASLNLTMIGMSAASLEQGDNDTITYTYRVYYDDLVTEETDDSGYSISVYSNDGTDVSGNFSISAPVYTGLWAVQISNYYTTPINTNYYIGIRKSSGSEGDTLAEEYATNDLGSGGSFDITPASLNIVYTGRTPASFGRADNSGLTYSYNVYYDTMIDEITNDTASFSIAVLDDINLGISSDYHITTPVYTNAHWEVNIQAYNTTPVGSNRKIEVAKSSGMTTTVLNATRSDLALGAAGRFTLLYGTPTVHFTNITLSSFERADGNGTRYEYQILFPDGSELTNSTHSVQVYDALNINRSTDFIISPPQYTNGRWEVSLETYDTTPPASNYRLGIEKTTTDTFPIEYATNDLGTQGTFTVHYATLNITFLSNTTNSIIQADGIGTTYSYSVLYDDGITQETNDTGYHIIVYNKTNHTMTNDFIIGSPVYISNHWEVTIQTYDTTPVDTNYRIAVYKTAGSEGDTLSEELSTNDLGSSGTFSVLNEANLTITYLSRDVSWFRRTDGIGTTYTYQIFYQNGTTQETNDTGYIISVYDCLTNLVNSNFIIGTPAYSNNRWHVTVQGTSATPIATNYFIGIRKTNGLELDTMDEEYATRDLGTNALFDIADLRLVMHSISNSIIEQADDIAVHYSFTLYTNESTNALSALSGFTVSVYNAATNNVTGDFIVTGPTYSLDHWEVTLQSFTNTTVASGYFITIEKDYSDGHALPTESVRDDLGISAGCFTITEATLNITYSNRLPASFEKADGIGVTYTYSITYDNGIEENNDSGYSVTVYNATNAPVNSLFLINPPVFTNHHWEVNIQSFPGTFAEAGYRIGIRKTAGTKGDILVEEISTNDLGALNGVFEVKNATLNIVYTARSNSIIERADNIHTIYHYRVLYDDMTTPETGDTIFYTIDVFDKNNVRRNADFLISKNYESSGGYWRTEIKAYANAITNDGYYIEVKKTNGGSSGATLGAAPEVPKKSTSDLGATNGSFTVTPATLNIAFNARNNATIERADGIGTTYTFKILYDDLLTEENNDTGYTIRVYNASNIDVSSNFSIGSIQYSFPYWSVTIEAHANAPAFNGYYIQVSKTAGSEGDTALPENSNNGDITPIVNSTFSVAPTILFTHFTNLSTNTLVRADGNSLTYDFRVYYPNFSQETNDTGYTARVYTQAQSNISSLFTISVPVYSNNAWHVDIQATSYSPAASNYYMTIEKFSGNNGDILPETRVTASTQLGSGGYFTVLPEPTLTFNALYLSTNILERADNGLTFGYQIFYDDGVSQETNDAGYTITVYDIHTNDISAEYSISAPVYIVSNWTVTIKARTQATIQSNIFIGITKSGGMERDTMTEQYSYDTLGSGGYFQIIPALLRIQFLSRSNAVVEQFDNTAVEYRYQVFYNDGITQETNSPADYHIHVFTSNNIDISAQFSIAAPVYNSGSWKSEIWPLDISPVGQGYVISIEKTNGVSSDTSAAVNATNDLGINARFAVTEATLNLYYSNMTPNSIRKLDGSSIHYSFTVSYDNGTPLTNDAAAIQCIIYSPNGADVSAVFSNTALRYSNLMWHVYISATAATYSSNDYYLALSKTAGNSGDTVIEKTATADLGTNGRFDVRPGILHAVFSNRTPAVCERSDGVGITYRYAIVYPDNKTEETNDTGYVLRVYNAADNDVSAHFILTTPQYTNNAWQARIQTYDTTAISNGYYITIEKSNGMLGNILNETASTNMLSSTGRFDITPASLNLSVDSLSPLIVGQSDPGVTLQYRLFYDDGITQETNDTGYQFTVRTISGIDVSTNFTITPQGYSLGTWRLLVTPLPLSIKNSNYYITVEKSAGTEGDTLALESSMTDLGTNGRFMVVKETLHVAFSNISTTAIEHADGIGTTLSYKIFYPDSTEETNDSGYLISISNANSPNATTNFTITSPHYTNGVWQITIHARPEAALLSNCMIGIQKNAGNTGNILTYTIITNSAGTPVTFNIVPTQLTAHFTDISPHIIELSETVHATFNLYYKNAVEITNHLDTSWITIYNSAHSDVTTDFILSLQYQGNQWHIQCQSRTTTTPGTNFIIAVHGSYNNDILTETLSTNDLSQNGLFAINQANLTVRFIRFDKKTVAINDTIALTFTIMYPDHNTPVTNGLSTDAIAIIDAAGATINNQFMITDPFYSGTAWTVILSPKPNAAAGRGIYVKVFGAIAPNSIMPNTTRIQLGEQNGTFIVIRETEALQNFPNPFNPTVEHTTFWFTLLDTADDITVRIYTLSGNLVRELNTGDEINRTYEVIWDGRNDAGEIVAGGLYYAVFTIGKYQKTIRVMVVK